MFAPSISEWRNPLFFMNSIFNPFSLFFKERTVLLKKNAPGSIPF